MTGVPVVYDTGALLAAEANDVHIRWIHREALAGRRAPLVPAPVLTQAWRGTGPRQARLALFLAGCHYEPIEERVAKLAGVLLGRSGHADAVDALVAAIAVDQGKAIIVTSDPKDIGRLVETVDPHQRPDIVSV